MYELLVRERIVKNGSMHDMLVASITPSYPPPSSVRDDVPKKLEAVLMKALAKSPSDRYESARAFADALEDAVPRSVRAGAAKELVEQAFGDQIAIRRAEVKELLELPPPPEKGPHAIHTTSFIRREGVPPITQDDLPPLSTNEAWIPQSLLPHLSLASITEKVVPKPEPAAPVPRAAPPAAEPPKPAQQPPQPQPPASRRRPLAIAAVSGALALALFAAGVHRARTHRDAGSPPAGAALGADPQALLARATALRGRLHDGDPGAAELDKLISDLTFDNTPPGSRERGEILKRAEALLSDLEKTGR